MDGTATMYDANSLNQYTSIAVNGGTPFIPQFDADGNQTIIKTETGIWSAVYNAENRPVSFTNSESNTVVESAYDSMERRAYKKVTTNGSVTLHLRYIYRGYLQIACSDPTTRTSREKIRASLNDRITKISEIAKKKQLSFDAAVYPRR